MAGSPAELTDIGANYMLTRNYKESIRLHVQDWLWRTQLGFLLHPRIEDAVGGGATVHVMDVGCSNATWLLSLALSRPSNWSFTGIDVSTDPFPAVENLPPNVSLQQLDAFKPFPAELHGRFDVVHVRALALVVKGGSPLPLVRNLMQLLKPGGFIQWDDVDTNTMHAVPPRPSVPVDGTASFLEHWVVMSHRLGLASAWVQSMDQAFAEAGLAETASIRLEPLPALRKAWTDNMLAGFEQHRYTIVLADPTLLGTPAEFNEALSKVIVEAGQGVAIDVDSYCAIGRKAA